MIVVKLQGGLGNQMFQYAAGRVLSYKYNVPLKLDIRFLLDRTPRKNAIFRDFDLDIFPNISIDFATKKDIAAFTVPFSANPFFYFLKRKLKRDRNVFKETSVNYQPEFNSITGNVYLDGYWQSEKYFKSLNEIIRHDFSFGTFAVEKNLKLKDEILSQNSVCINVRRGDFVSNPNSSGFHGFTGLDYILNAVKLITKKINSPHFFIFSDDIEWCEENIKLDFPLRIVDHSHAGYKFSDYLRLMTYCKHFIIPNSSFAWWAAWLSNYKDKTVIAPVQWFKDDRIDTKDLIPEGWIKI